MPAVTPRLPGLIYRAIIRVQPREHRDLYGDEQWRVFQEVWLRERPPTRFARLMWFIAIMTRSLWSAIGVWIDRRRTAVAAIGNRRTMMGSDLAYTLRGLRHARWYSAAVIGVVAITFALATTVFAVVDGVLFKSLPYPDAGRLVSLAPTFRSVSRPARNVIYTASPTDLEYWQSAVPGLVITGFRVQPWSGLFGGVNDDVAGVASVRPNFFESVGVRPMIGGFADGDFVTSTSRVMPVVLMYDTWQTRFGRDPDVVGRTTILDPTTGFGVRIVGIMPSDFSFPSGRWGVQLLTALKTDPARSRDLKDRALTDIIARVPPGVRIVTLGEQLTPGIAAAAAAFPALGPKPEGWSDNAWRREGPYEAVDVTPLNASVRAKWQPMFRAVFAAVAVLVLLAAANASSLMTSRALERTREFQMRRALGAGAGAIVRLWAIEVILLVAAGALIGAIAAAPLLKFIVSLLPEDIVLLKPAALDWRVGAFVVAALAAVSALIAIAPIRRSLRASGAVPAGVTPRVRTWTRFAVVGGQTAAAFVLTILGACLVGSLLVVYSNHLAVSTRDVVVVDTHLQGPGSRMGTVSPERVARGQQILERLSHLPGVSHVSLIAAQLLSGGGWQAPFQPPPGRSRVPDTDMWAVTEGFYDTLDMHAIEGRVPTDAELRAGEPLIVVSEKVARAFWPDGAAVGHTLMTYERQPFTVVGVVRDVPWYAWDQDAPMIYGPYAPLSTSPFLTFLIRTKGSTGDVTNAALKVIKEVDPLVRPRRAAALDTMFRDSVVLRRLQSWLFGGFAAAALVVVGVGILGLLAMSTARRTKEIGIRCALGATPDRVMRQLVGEQFKSVAAGLVIGGVIAAWAVGFVKGYLYKLSVADARIWGAAMGLIVIVACLGALLPALRASRIDPVRALRTD